MPELPEVELVVRELRPALEGARFVRVVVRRRRLRSLLPRDFAARLEGAKVRLVYMPTRAGDYALNLARLKAMGTDKVWATPKIPFMIPLFLGFVAAFLIGDVIMSATLWFMDGA